MDPRLKNLDYLFKPKSIAFVGATEALTKWGFIVLNNLISGGYEGKLYPVNPSRDTVLDLKAYPSVRDVPGEVDMAVFTVPARMVIESVDDCVAKGVKAGMVISAGFKELGGDFEDLELELTKRARQGGMVLAGPNGQGVCCPSANLYAWMPHFYYPRPGPVAVLSQSGNVQGLLIEEIVKSGLGVSKGVSSGNEADIKSSDYFQYLADDPETEVILSYLEGLTDGQSFLESARRAALKKPVVVLKGGRTNSGISAAGSHTGAMAVSDDLFDAVCRQSGVTRASSIQEAGTIAGAFVNRPLPKGKRVGIVTGGGGLGVIASDACSDLGLEVVKLSDQTLAKIGKMMPDWWVPGNPIDLVAGNNFQTILPILTTLMSSGEVDAVMMLFMGTPRTRDKANARDQAQMEAFENMWRKLSKTFKAFADALDNMTRRFEVPLYTVSNFRDSTESIFKTVFEEQKNSIFPTIETACASIRAMADYREFRQKQG